MARADILNSFVQFANLKASQSGYLVKTPSDVYYWFFFYPGDNGLYVTTSTDGGFSWSSPASLRSSAINSVVSVWYDKWTPGNTGTIIHVAYIDAVTDDVFYRPVDAASAVPSLGTEVVIFAGASTGVIANMCLSITRAIGGNLYCAFDMDGGTETGFYRSTDAGSTWGSRTDVNEPPGTDYYLLAPGFAADNQDIICIYWDRSASEISRKLYDDSGDSWSESSIAGSMTAIATSTTSPQFALSVDDANNKILLVAWTNRNTVNADLRFWTIDESSITEGTNVVLNSAGSQQGCTIALNTQTGVLYVFYGGNSSASDLDVFYKTSSDNGASWSSETELSNGQGAYSFLITSPLFTGDFTACFGYDGAGPDSLFISALFPSAGGNNVAAPILGGYVLE